MYRVIDENLLKVYYLNKITRGEIKDMYEFELKNVRYSIVRSFFDQQLKITKIKIIDPQKPAYVLTTDGFVKWKPPHRTLPPNVVDYLELLREVPFIKISEDETILELMKNYLDRNEPQIYMNSKPLCFSYVCFNYPQNPVQLTKDDFFAINDDYFVQIGVNDVNITENGDKVIFEYDNVSRFTLIGINLENRKIPLLFTLGRKVVLTKGTCFFLYGENKTVCY